MYRFVDLADEEKHRRRELLDWYGLFAQLSVLVPLLVVQVFFLSSWLKRRLVSRKEFEAAPSSPYAKKIRGEQRFDTKDLTRRWRGFTWWCGGAVQVAGLSLGTKGELLGASLWAAWLVLLSFLQTGDGKYIGPFARLTSSCYELS